MWDRFQVTSINANVVYGFKKISNGSKRNIIILYGRPESINRREYLKIGDYLIHPLKITNICNFKPYRIMTEIINYKSVGTHEKNSPFRTPRSQINLLRVFPLSSTINIIIISKYHTDFQKIWEPNPLISVKLPACSGWVTWK